MRRTPILLSTVTRSPYPRLAAKAIDLLIVTAIYFLGTALWWPLGIASATFLCLAQDGFGVGQSIGKRIIGLQVVEDANGFACSLGASAVRNLSFATLFLFSFSPVLWLFLVVLTLPVIGFEIFLLLTLDSRTRLGDVLANTAVVDYAENMMHLDFDEHML